LHYICRLAGLKNWFTSRHNELNFLLNMNPSSILKSHEHPEALKLSFRNLLEPLLVLFNKAAGSVLKGHSYYIAHSIPGGVYGYFNEYEVKDHELKQIRERLKKLIKEKADFNNELLPREKLLRYFKKNGRRDIIRLLNSKEDNISNYEGLRLACINGHGELFLNHIHENYEKLQNFRLFKFQKGFFLVADPEFFDRVMPDRIELSKYFRRFNETEETMKHLGLSSFAELNEVINQGELPEFLKISEAYQSKRISRIADNIISHPLKPRLIFLAGPTSSGKNHFGQPPGY